MWVVEYRQYPNPAGLTVISKDQYYRSVYDKTPLAPPNHTKGADRISIHQDTNGDGIFDQHKTFLDGLNIVTAVERGRGGVWVLNPPYLLFYPDANNDDVPDSDPEVHLEGFGLEDTHSCTNSLRWGPDGWLYAAQGSTVTGNIIRPGIDKKPVRSMGQLIWRYHPTRKIYEIFAEGGGNAFGVEIDSSGRIYSGHNGGNTRGFHYPQGGYLRKGFTKHGALSNPYAFGFFPNMKHPNVERFTHNFVIYEGDALPQQYRGKLFGIEPLQGRVVETEIKPRGSTFETKDIQFAVTTSDRWFCPVDIKIGPDGGIYVCDWYDNNVSHLEASVGKTDKEDGRIYRLIAKNAKPVKPFDLGKLPSIELIEYLKHPNRWFRQTTLRILGDRKDESVLPILKKWLIEDQAQLSLECLWAIYQIEGVEASLKFGLLDHKNPKVRAWTFRLLCDEKRLPPSVSQFVDGFVYSEPDVETRTQIASSAKRLAKEHSLRIIQSLLHHQSDSTDPYQPLLIWWAIESNCEHGDQIIELTRSTKEFWKNRLVVDHLAERLAKRFTLPAQRSSFITLATLLEDAHRNNPDVAKKMLNAVETASKSMTNLVFPQELLQVITKLGGGSLELQVRQKDMPSIQKAIRLLDDQNQNLKQQVRLIRALGDVGAAEAVPALKEKLNNAQQESLQIAILESLQKFDSQEIGDHIINILPELKDEARTVAESVLVSRVPWSISFLKKLENEELDLKEVSEISARRLLFHDSQQIRDSVHKIFGDVSGATDAAMRKTIDQYFQELESGKGSPYEGKKLFSKNCGKCHQLYQNGGDIGPNLTSYQRSDVKSMLLHVVNPSAEIREGFENILFSLDDGRVVSGFIQDQGKQQLVVRTAEGTDIRMDIATIENRKSMRQSIMPAKILDSLTAQQRRDLFAYLRSTQPLNN